MKYVDYDYYTNKYGGDKLTSQNFDKYELKARISLDNYTRKPHKIKKFLDEDKFTNEIKLCMCELMDNSYDTIALLALSQETDELYAQGITSASVKSTSASFDIKNMKSNEIKSLSKQESYNIMNNYLNITGLLYRGI